MVNTAKLASLNVLSLDFNKSKHLDNDGYLNFESIYADLKPNLINYRNVSCSNSQAVNDGIHKLQRLSDVDRDDWLNIGNTKSSASLYVGLNIPNQHNYVELAKRQAKLPLQHLKGNPPSQAGIHILLRFYLYFLKPTFLFKVYHHPKSQLGQFPFECRRGGNRRLTG
jgi:hypothetical protein